MTFKLIDSDWHKVIRRAAKADRSALRVVCPFIKERAARSLLDAVKPERILVITRFSQSDFYEGVSDTAALRLLLEHGARIRGVKNLHAKLYLFGNSSALVTSANLTEAAMATNHELGFVSDDPHVVKACRSYFTKLWNRAGRDVESRQLDRWEERLNATWTQFPGVNRPKGLRDEGVDAGLPEVKVIVPERIAEAPQAFVKFFGMSKGGRWLRSENVLYSVEHAGCHWACTYPKDKRPRQVKDGATMFLARMVKDPDDIIVFGQATGRAHVPGRDDASKEDLERRDWKKKWPHYIRVHHPTFVAGTLENGVSLNRLIEKFGPRSFATTAKNLVKGSGNIDPRRAYMRRADVQLSEVARKWLNKKLQQAFETHGKLTRSQLRTLDWPEGEFAEPEGE